MYRIRFLLALIPPLTVLFFLLLLSSCSPTNKFKAEIEEIDSCLLVLENIETDLNGIEFDSLQMMVDHVLMNEDTIKKYYDPDTLTLHVGMRMNECKGIRKSLQSLEAKEQTYHMEIASIRKQFEDLKDDIENGFLKKEEMRENINAEQNGLIALNKSFFEFYQLQKGNKQFYYYSVPVIDSLIVELKNEQAF